MEPRIGGNGRGAVCESLLRSANAASMLPTVNKQGYLGNLHEKSQPELTDLLERQEKLLKNRKFIDHLPDKGEKIRKFVQTLQDVIAEKESTKEYDVKSEDGSSPADVKEKQNGDNEIKMEEDHEEIQHTKHEEELKIIERGFEQLTVHEGPHYQVVVKAEERKQKKSKFSLNRPQKTDENSPSPGATIHAKSSTAELTSASIHDPEHGPATLISVSECRTLYSTQQKKLQESRAEQFAERMLRRFNPDHPEGSYRSKTENQEDGDLLDPDQDFLDSVD